MMGYISYFNVVKSRDIISSPYNKRQDSYADRVIRGKILSVDTREIRNEKTIIIFSVTDFTDTIVLKIFARNDDVAELLKEISGGKFVRVKGVATIDKFDSELTIGSIVGI